MSEEYVELKLSSGAIVRCAPVPPTAIPKVVIDHPDCQMPPPPVEEIQGKLGITKTIARPGSAEYAKWEQQVEQVRLARERVGRTAQYVVSVIAWKLPGAKNFSSKVPKSWKFPERLTRIGLKPAEDAMGKIGDFIEYELFRTADDFGKVTETIFGATEPLTENEIATTEDFFRGDEEGQADTEETG